MILPYTPGGRGAQTRLRERPIIGPGVGSGLKRPQEIECRFRGNTSLSTPTPTSEVNPTPNPRRPGPDPPSRRLRVDESHAEQSTEYSANTGVSDTESAGNVSSKFRHLLLGNRGDQGGFDRRAGAALTASVPIQQDRANSQSNVEAVRADARPSTLHRVRRQGFIARLVVRGSIKAGEPSGHIKSMAATTPLTSKNDSVQATRDAPGALVFT
jgi:hypothetical protein